MKVGTLTLHNANNLGAALQSYALQQHLISLGIETEIINFIPNKVEKIENIDRRKKLNVQNKINKLLTYPDRKKKQIKFEKFRREKLNISNDIYDGDNSIIYNYPKYDAYIVGSDQVWNTNITNNSKAFYLNFPKEGLKISYAASFGKDNLNEDEINNVREYLPKFDYISLREKTTADNLNKEYNYNIKNVLDPVFLLNNTKWEEIMTRVNAPKKYIFVYIMEPSLAISKVVNELSKKTGCKVLYVSASSKNVDLIGKRLKGLDPCEFLYLIKNANYVVTNSFHGCSFSILFGKETIVAKHSTLNSRIYNLLNSVGYADKIIDNNINCNLNDVIIDGLKARENIQEQIELSKQFISNSLSVEVGDRV